MEKDQYEQYDYARKRIKQKKGLYFHFVFLALVSLFLFIAIKFFGVGANSNWHIWIITGWLFIFILHFIKVYITDRFMNKNWEKEQIERLVALQQKKIAQLQQNIEEDSTPKQ